MKSTIKMMLLASLLTLGAAGAVTSFYETAHEAEVVNAVSEGFVYATKANAYTRTDYSGSYYSSVNLNATGDTLLQSLRTLTTSNYEGSSYDGLKTGLPAVCKPADGSNYMVGFYNRAHLTTKWDSAFTWNREHTWPNSRGAGETGAGSNPFTIMPTSVSINSARGNKFYGLGGSNTWDPGQYDEQFRGAAARCILYAAMHYFGIDSLSENPGDSASNNTMGIKSLLLEWNKTYAPDDDESYRNELTAKEYGIRNPFIDYPYLADNIWGDGSDHSGDSSYDTSSTPAENNPDYTLVTGALNSGDKIIINSVSTGSGYAMSKNNINDSRPWYKSAESSSVSDGGLTSTSNMAVFTVAKVDGGYTLTETEKGALLAYTSTGSDGKTHTSIGYESDTISSDAKSTIWNVTIGSNGAATLVSTVGSTSIYLTHTVYNSTPEYLASTTASSVYLFKYTGGSSGGDTSSDSGNSSETPSTEPQYVLTSSALQTGDKILINNVDTGSGYALSKNNVNDERPWYKAAEATTVSTGVIEPSSSVAIFTVTAVDGGYTLVEEEKGALVAYTSGTHTSVSYESDTFSSDAKSTTWNITIGSDGAANLVSTVGSTDIYLEFTTYTSSSGTTTPEYQGSTTASTLYLFKLTENDSSSSDSSGAGDSSVTPSGDSSSDNGGSGCFSSLGGGIVAVVVGLIGVAIIVILKMSKKKEQR